MDARGEGVSRCIAGLCIAVDGIENSARSACRYVPAPRRNTYGFEEFRGDAEDAGVDTRSVSFRCPLSIKGSSLECRGSQRGMVCTKSHLTSHRDAVAAARAVQ
jgi:hypothetical protein